MQYFVDIIAIRLKKRIVSIYVWDIEASTMYLNSWMLKCIFEIEVLYI